MSQFGYAEEPGENKASADIYAVISPLSRYSAPHWVCVITCCMRKRALLPCYKFGYLHKNNLQ